MPYLSLAAVIGEMNGAEADAKRMIDLSYEPLRQQEEKPEPKLKEKVKPAGLLDSSKGIDITKFLNQGSNAK